MHKKIVITGILIFTPLGSTIEENWNNLLHNKSGFSGYSEGTKDISSKISTGEIKKLINKKNKWITVFNKLINNFIKLNNKKNSFFRKTSLCLGTSFLGINNIKYNEVINKYIKKINRKYNFNNGIYINTNTCAGGNFALKNGADLIKSGFTDIAVCGGIDVISEYIYSGFSALRSLSKSESKPFSINRDGMSLGEGGALIILEELDSALKRKSNIICEYAGFGTSCDNEKITVMDKTGDGMCKCFENALNDAGIKKDNIDLICAHGTGTKLNDAVEAEMIKKYFGKNIYIQALKSFFGHSMSASSAISAGILAYNLKKQKVIRIRNLDKPLNDINFVRNTGEAELNYGINNAFGFGGINSCLVLKRYIK